MSDESYTAAQAADPATPPQVLADIAAVRPDLRPAVAANPSAYPSLLEWLGGLGEPAVDSALRNRAAAPAAQTATLPTAVTPPGAGYPGPGYGPPAQGYTGQTPGYAQAGAPGYGTPPGATAPGYGYAGTPPTSGSNKKALWIILGIVGGLILLGIIAAVVIGLVFRNAVDNLPEDLRGDNTTYGSDAELDALYDRCGDEDWQACDDLFQQAPIGSEYEEYGDTCGGRTEGGTLCTEEFAEGDAAGLTDEDTTTDDGTAVQAYGDDAELDALYDQCGSGDMLACDVLYKSSDVGSEYESFADTCGGTTEGSSWCATDAPSVYGDDPAFDALYDQCAAGDNQACDDLYMTSPGDSEYESFGSTCAGRSDGEDWCVP
jgi:hypothetical protein